MREIRLSGSEGGGANPIVSPYPYLGELRNFLCSRERESPRQARGISLSFHTVSVATGSKSCDHSTLID